MREEDFANVTSVNCAHELELELGRFTGVWSQHGIDRTVLVWAVYNMEA